jgi:hypothetical protein
MRNMKSAFHSEWKLTIGLLNKLEKPYPDWIGPKIAKITNEVFNQRWTSAYTNSLVLRELVEEHLFKNMKRPLQLDIDKI